MGYWRYISLAQSNPLVLDSDFQYYQYLNTRGENIRIITTRKIVETLSHQLNTNFPHFPQARPFVY